jgi:5-methylcytosine-specific restriction protein A
MKLRTLGSKLQPSQQFKVKQPPKLTKAFYLGSVWRTFINDLIARRGRRCEVCGRTHCRIFGDHTVELKDGGAPLEAANVKLLCGSCHTSKTIAARQARLARP